MAKRKRLGEVLLDACIITDDQLQEALRVQQGNHRRLIGQVLVEMGWVSEQEVCRAVSELLHVKYVDVENALISQEVVQLAPENLASKRNILPLFIQDKRLFLAMENPLDVDTIQRIEFQTGMQISPLVAPPSQLRETIRKHYDVDEYIGGMLNNVQDADSVSVDQEEDADTAIDISEARKISEGSKVVKLANMLISEGIKKRASDIHIEPTVNRVDVRYRVDGLLTKGLAIPKWLQLPLISRIKVVAGLDIAEHRKPQDGRIRVTYTKRKIDLRISTLPANFGEKVVIRILDKKTSSHDLTRLGFSESQLTRYHDIIQQPQGWILVTGPTGSGKTTTLYASLNTIKDETKSIVTVEDPIEYQLEGINQVQVNPKAGMTFASGLRSILRQDPNVILIGEIRDTETASIAMQAAETGHLVLSTLHTNDAVSTVNRLLNLGVSPDLVASNLLVVIAQRLVRRICPKCKTEYIPEAAEFVLIDIHSGQKSPFTCYRGKGCSTCKHTGYYGQVAVYEMFIPTRELTQVIASRPTKQALRDLARKLGMQMMLDDGIEKIRQGLTTIEEVARVCPVEQEERPNLLTCPDCGGMLTADNPVCPHCQTTPPRTCRECGANLDEQWKVCPFCGIPVQKDMKIPAPRVPEEISVQQPVESEAESDTIRVVAADDEAHIRDMVKVLLETQGYHVISAVDGQDALNKIRAELPDLIVLDVNMPKRDGFSVCKAVRSAVETMFIPVIMLTGQDSIAEKLEGLSSGADDYITKPFNAEELLARIDTVLRRASRSQGSAALHGGGSTALRGGGSTALRGGGE